MTQVDKNRPIVLPSRALIIFLVVEFLLLAESVLCEDNRRWTIFGLNPYFVLTIPLIFWLIIMVWANIRRERLLVLFLSLFISIGGLTYTAINFPCDIFIEYYEPVGIKKLYTELEIMELSIILNNYKINKGSYPSDIQQIMIFILSYKPTQMNNTVFLDMLSRDKLNDRWGHKFIYNYPGIRNPQSYDIYSLGPDGKDGTEDDIGNWNLDKMISRHLDEMMNTIMDKNK